MVLHGELVVSGYYGVAGPEINACDQFTATGARSPFQTLFRTQIMDVFFYDIACALGNTPSIWCRLGVLRSIGMPACLFRNIRILQGTSSTSSEVARQGTHKFPSTLLRFPPNLAGRTPNQCRARHIHISNPRLSPVAWPLTPRSLLNAARPARKRTWDMTAGYSGKGAGDRAEEGCPLSDNFHASIIRTAGTLHLPASALQNGNSVTDLGHARNCL